MSGEPLVLTRGLKKQFLLRRGWPFGQEERVYAVDGVNLAVGPGETLALVGESGSGKSTLGRVILSLLPPTEGEILFEGTDLARLSPRELRRTRRKMQMIFQDPNTSLNPRMRVGQIVEEPLRIHTDLDRTGRAEKVAAILDRVGLPKGSVDRYPHEFSGGQRQRIGIARALILHPRLVVADEPVSALDLSVQTQVIRLMMELKKEMHLAYLLITHDLSLVKQIADRTAVMYLGKIVEEAPSATIHGRPLHPYAEALLSAIPAPEPGVKKKRVILKGDPPSPTAPPSGCHFHTRCPLYEKYKEPVCIEVDPPLLELEPAHRVACHLRAKGYDMPPRPPEEP
jgi:oligopeptide/dipeptide ABC transporter ATP-binding protein